MSHRPPTAQPSSTMRTTCPQPIRLQLRRPINQWLGKIGLRMVNSQWGPVGFIRALQSAKAQGFEPQQIMDIGASNGSWTRECMTVFPEADYFLVEPREAQQAALKTLTHEHPNVAFWTGALGQEAGQLTLLDHGDQSSFLNSEFGDSTGRTTEVQSLDSLLVNKRIPFPNLIKADVQGFELEVFRGGAECLRHAELLLVEVSFRRVYDNCPLAHEVIAFLAERGFRILDICSYAQRVHDGLLAQSDLLFARAESSLFAYEAWR